MASSQSTEVLIFLQAYDLQGHEITSPEDPPLRIKLGQREIFQALEEQILNMGKGETALIELKCQDTFGPHDGEKLFTFPRTYFETPNNLEKGLCVSFIPENQKEEIVGRITHLCKDRATIDTNHPLCGKTLFFKITLIDVFTAE